MLRLIIVPISIFVLTLGFLIGLQLRKFENLNYVKIEEIWLDKEEYKGGEPISIKILVYSSDDLKDAEVSLTGLTSKYNRNYIDMKKRIDLKSGLNIVEFSSKLPYCSACAGIPPGSYELEAGVSLKNVTLASSSTTLKLVR